MARIPEEFQKTEYCNYNLNSFVWNITHCDDYYYLGGYCYIPGLKAQYFI